MFGEDFSFRNQQSIDLTSMDVKMSASGLNVHYRGTENPKHALKDIDVTIPEGLVTAFIGPSGCGKSSLLKCFNRMIDTTTGSDVSGQIKLDDTDIYKDKLDVVQLRARVGMIFQKYNPFPKTIFDNVAYGPKIHGLASSKPELSDIVESSLRRAALWDEVKDDLHSKMGTSLSGGQQQRLCIARAIAVQPEVLLMDEPCSALDPVATAKIEQLISELRGQFTIAIVTHSMHQAARVSDKTVFLYEGEIEEEGDTRDFFIKPKKQKTADYIIGRYG